MPIWVEKNLGGWTLFGGAGYGINPGADGRNAWFEGVAALYSVTETLRLGGEIFRQGAQSPDAPDATGFNLGGTWELTEGRTLLVSAGRGLTHAAESNQFSAYLGMQFIF